MIEVNIFTLRISGLILLKIKRIVHFEDDESG